jgi:hypothetical protein
MLPDKVPNAVVEFTIEPRLDPAMFNPASGSIKLDQCTMQMTMEIPYTPR